MLFNWLTQHVASPEDRLKELWMELNDGPSWWMMGRFLRSQLHDVPVAAVQRALSRRPVLGLELWSHSVDDEPRRQVEAFGQLGLARPTSCTQTNKQQRLFSKRKFNCESSWLNFEHVCLFRFLNNRICKKKIQVVVNFSFEFRSFFYLKCIYEYRCDDVFRLVLQLCPVIFFIIPVWLTKPGWKKVSF